MALGKIAVITISFAFLISMHRLTFITVLAFGFKAKGGNYASAPRLTAVWL